MIPILLLQISGEMQMLLATISFLAGVGITTIGPGGIFLTIALYALLTLSPGQVAGTASATFVASSIIGLAVYFKSGELHLSDSPRLALLITLGSVIGAFVGPRLNALLSLELFGALLGLMTVATGAIIVIQTRNGLEGRYRLDARSRFGILVLLALGFGIGVSGALLGVGGPVLAVPALVVLGFPMLLSVAVAQVQALFISGFATLGYALQGEVLWMLALIVGVPQVFGAIGGWWIAHRIEPARLRFALGGVLVAIGAVIPFM